MPSIGLIILAEESLDCVAKDWVPASLGSRYTVDAAIEASVAARPGPLRISFAVDATGETDEVRAITVTGQMGDSELACIRRLCNALGARYYDSEVADFVEL